MADFTWDSTVTDAVAGDFSTCYVLLRKSGSPDVAREIALQSVLTAAADGTASAPGIAFGADTNTGIYRITTDKLGIATAGTLRMAVLADGKVGIGTTNPVKQLQVYNGGSTAAFVVATDDRNDGFFVTPAVGMQATSTTAAFGSFSNHDVQFLVNGGAKLVLESGGHLRSGSDNAYSSGTASYRWSVVYAGTGAINTSDERDKKWRGGLTDAERAAARDILAQVGIYQWQESVDEKGADAARLHVGVRAQRVWQIMADHGLVEPIGDDGKPTGKCPYAFLCFDEWDATGEPDADDFRPAGWRYGLRYDQLTLFLLPALVG